MHLRFIVAAFALVAFSVRAEEPGHIAPLPFGITDDSQQRIAPPDSDEHMLTTHKPTGNPSVALPAPLVAPSKSPAAPQPETKPTPPPQVVPFGAGNKAPASYVPFGHAEPVVNVPSGPHTTVATPVVGVDSVEVSDPAPPTPVAPEADPVTQDPAQPTELTSPIFGEQEEKGPRKIVIRALNKVTAQSTLFKSAPREIVKFGRLEITTVDCRISAPDSQTDYAGLLDISEQLPGTQGQKQLFHGWMYASSPSISALEHPIYDVTMVLCEVATPEAKPDKKSQKKAKK